jgi:hypothetical protein
MGALAAAPVAAGTIYKSVDRDGNVTYAAQPLPNAVKVEPLTAAEPPSEEQVAEAEKQAAAINAFNERVDKERKEAAKEEAALRAAAGRTVIVERPYLLPVPSGDYWWGAPPLPPGHPIRPLPPRPSPPPAPTPRPGGGMRR